MFPVFSFSLKNNYENIELPYQKRLLFCLKSTDLYLRFSCCQNFPLIYPTNEMLCKFNIGNVRGVYRGYLIVCVVMSRIYKRP